MPLAVLRSTDEWIARFGAIAKDSVVTIGNFDGVHRGHQAILHRVRTIAEENECISAVLTFYPHPSSVLRPLQAPALLMTLDQRLAAMEASGMDAALVARFSTELAQVGPEDFVRRFLVDTMKARAVLVGGNFRFGHAQAGDVLLLGELGKRWGFHVELVPPVLDDGIIISSTGIREAVREGLVEGATRMLGRPFALEGVIATGTGQGRKLIVPTLNLATEQELLPEVGVYATEVIVQGKTYRAATNVGVRPTFDGKRLSIESHLFDFNEDLTSGKLEVRFHKRLRDERKFSGAAELREQVLIDIERAREYFQESKVG